MTLYHKRVEAGWGDKSLAEQMGHIGSEISRALNWRAKGRREVSQRALHRGLELLDMTVASQKGYCRRRELLRVREALVDFFCGQNVFASSESGWRRYFDAFVFLHKNR